MTTRSKENTLDAFPSYRGGRTTLYGGYIYEMCPNHPDANIWGYVSQHRLIAEDMLGRPLHRSDDPKIREMLIEVIRYFAPTYMTFGELAKLTRVCAKHLASLAREHKIAWTRTPLGAPGKKRMVYRGKPTRSALALDGLPTVSATRRL